MSNHAACRLRFATAAACLAGVALIPAGSAPAWTQEPAPWAQPAGVVLDRVVAVVNSQAILASDVDLEIRLSVLEPGSEPAGALTPMRVLDQLIGRALIQQQMRQEEPHAEAPPQPEVDSRLKEIRKEVPACVHENCTSDEGWKAFLAAHRLTQQNVEAWLRVRLRILGFIEQRFRQGIRIQPQEVAAYYHDTLLPQYSAGEAIPPLEKVSPRIEEILLQQRVNVLFDQWLEDMRKQGDVEILDPALQGPETPAAGAGEARE
jgi:hypothetical protein